MSQDDYYYHALAAYARDKTKYQWKTIPVEDLPQLATWAPAEVEIEADTIFKAVEPAQLLIDKWVNTYREMVKGCQHSMGKSVRLFVSQHGNYYIGYRWHDMGGTAYQYEHLIPWEVAKYLYLECRASEVYDDIKNRIHRENQEKRFSKGI